MRHAYTSQRQKRVDFWLGFTGWLLVNVVLLIVLSQLQVFYQQIASEALLVANVMAPIVLAFIRGFVALGIVTAFAAAFATVVVSGIVFTAGDFAAGGTGSFTGAIIVWLIGAVLILIGLIFALRAIHRSIK